MGNVLSDGTVTIKPFQLEKVEEHLLGDDKEQIKWLSGKKSTLEGVRAWIEKNQKYWENDGPIFNFAVVEKETGELMGMVEANFDYKNLDGVDEGGANISYALYPKARGKGYAARSVNLLLSFLKDKRLRQAVIRVEPENINSVKLAVRSGFKKQGEIITKDNKKLIKYTKDLN